MGKCHNNNERGLLPTQSWRIHTGWSCPRYQLPQICAAGRLAPTEARISPELIVSLAFTFSPGHFQNGTDSEMLSLWTSLAWGELSLCLSNLLPVPAAHPACPSQPPRPLIWAEESRRSAWVRLGLWEKAVLCLANLSCPIPGVQSLDVCPGLALTRSSTTTVFPLDYEALVVRGHASCSRAPWEPRLSTRELLQHPP